MPWGYKLARKLRLLRAFALTEWRTDMAYIGNRIAGAFAPLMYVGTFLIFISVLYDNVTTLAGYNQNQMLFLIFIGQISFYILSSWGTKANESLNKMVNDGTLDFLLLRPVNSLFLITVHKIKLFSLLINLCGPLVPVILMIGWSSLYLQPANILLGLPVICMGILVTQSLQFITTVPVFWTGRAYESHLLIYAASSQTIPLEGMPSWFKCISTGLFATYISSSVAASIMLGKGDPAFWLPVVIGVTTGILLIKRVVWRMALRQYASASS